MDLHLTFLNKRNIFCQGKNEVKWCNSADLEHVECSCMRCYQYQTRLVLSIAAILCTCPWKVPGQSSSAISPRSCSFNSSVPLTWARARSSNGIMIMWGKRDRAGGKGEAAVKAHPAPAATHGRLKKSKSPGIVAVRWYLGKQDCSESQLASPAVCGAAGLPCCCFTPFWFLP